MGSKKKAESYSSQDFDSITDSLAFMTSMFSVWNSLIVPVLHALGIVVRVKQNYTEGYNLEYVSCVEGNVLYIYGYRHPVTKSVRVQCYFNWEVAQSKYYGESKMLDYYLMNYYIAYGAIIHRASEAALVGMNATQADYAEYIKYQHQVIGSLRKPDGYVGGLKGLLAAWRIIFKPKEGK